ncbi:hypothetical protein BpHYR1_025286 [Brachionus plicatilis]|uniref:Uncharacterized protein n=1 Tax=Brachionus plicatilis TaxID=10195 RepID=A0A3M7PW42_BRAPC|nr:hypothetical protein BpHYR1_025286 [Brachionus plicatilis]
MGQALFDNWASKNAASTFQTFDQILGAHSLGHYVILSGLWGGRRLAQRTGNEHHIRICRNSDTRFYQKF